MGTDLTYLHAISGDISLNSYLVTILFIIFHNHSGAFISEQSQTCKTKCRPAIKNVQLEYQTSLAYQDCSQRHNDPERLVCVGGKWAGRTKWPYLTIAEVFKKTLLWTEGDRRPSHRPPSPCLTVRWDSRHRDLGGLLSGASVQPLFSSKLGKVMFCLNILFSSVKKEH